MENKNQYTLSGTSPPTVEQVEQRILAFLFTRALPATERQILKAVQVRKQLAVEALRKLLKRRKVRRLGIGQNKNAYLYFICGTCLLREAKKKNKKGGQS